jgi:hypothetical protein
VKAKITLKIMRREKTMKSKIKKWDIGNRNKKEEKEEFTK